jgi:hypothetical protein
VYNRSRGFCLASLLQLWSTLGILKADVEGGLADVNNIIVRTLRRVFVMGLMIPSSTRDAVGEYKSFVTSFGWRFTVATVRSHMSHVTRHRGKF